MVSVKGTYENGRIILTEKPIAINRANVIVTFLQEEVELPKRRKAGGIGKV
jgi:hypothetical protein